MPTEWGSDNEGTADWVHMNQSYDAATNTTSTWTTTTTTDNTLGGTTSTNIWVDEASEVDNNAVLSVNSGTIATGMNVDETQMKRLIKEAITEMMAESGDFWTWRSLRRG